MISRSPNRNTFQKEKYIERCQNEGKEPSEAYLMMFESINDEHDTKFDDPKSRVNNLEYDLLTTDWILEKVRNSESYAQNLYASMCNNDFIKNDVWPILQEETWGCSWRYAGGIIADMRQEGDYIDWYCSGIRDTYHNDDPIQDLSDEQLKRLEIAKRFVAESVVTDEIRDDLLKLGWIVVEDNSSSV